jgi:hypothetical protein
MERERSSLDDVIDLFAKDIDEAQLQAHLRRTPAERLEWLVQMATFTLEGRRALAGHQDADDDAGPRTR